MSEQPAESTKEGDSAAASSSVPAGPPLASLALQLTRQPWSQLSLNEQDTATAATPDLNVLVERVTALLLVRLVAIIAKPGSFPDNSTTMICTTMMHKKKASWPSVITADLTIQLHTYVFRILSGYKEVPYHNREHAYHVVLSVNKLLDLATCCYTGLDNPKAAPKKFRPPPSFGLRDQPLAMFALLFAALIHDVEHQGLPNRTLATENDRLAVLYNDQSIAENWSLYIAFSELLQDEFVELRECLFGTDIESTAHKENYASFRKMVINMVLSTDLASPERTQVGKSKWKEAFGEPHETVEAKLRAQRSRRRLPISRSSMASGTSNSNDLESHPENGDDSNDNLPTRSVFRRMTQESAMSEITTSATPRNGSDILEEEEDDDEGGGVNQGFASLDEADNESLSGTPDPSENGDEVTENKSEENEAGDNQPLTSVSAASMTKRLSNLTIESSTLSDRQPNNSLSISSEHIPHRSSLDNSTKSKASLNSFLNRSHHRFESRISRNNGNNAGRYRQRLGILRTVDLGGETLETYSRHDRYSSQSTVAYSVADAEMDEPDELKMTVVMETILAASDVAHNLQSWLQMSKWSKRLYFELRRAHVAGRGVDVSRNWFENQIGFLESYILPLARRLEDTGVWGDETTLPGIMFAQTVEDLRDEWFAKGYEVSQATIKDGEAQYPMDPMHQE